MFLRLCIILTLLRYSLSGPLYRSSQVSHLPSKTVKSGPTGDPNKYFIRSNQNWTWVDKHVMDAQLVRPQWIGGLASEHDDIVVYKPAYNELDEAPPVRNWVKGKRIVSRTTDLGVEEVPEATTEDFGETTTSDTDDKEVIIDEYEEIWTTAEEIVEEWTEDGWTTAEIPRNTPKVVHWSKREISVEDHMENNSTNGLETSGPEITTTTTMTWSTEEAPIIVEEGRTVEGGAEKDGDEGATTSEGKRETSTTSGLGKTGTASPKGEPTEDNATEDEEGGVDKSTTVGMNKENATEPVELDQPLSKSMTLPPEEIVTREEPGEQTEIPIEGRTATEEGGELVTLPDGDMKVSLEGEESKPPTEADQTTTNISASSDDQEESHATNPDGSTTVTSDLGRGDSSTGGTEGVGDDITARDGTTEPQETEKPVTKILTWPPEEVVSLKDEGESPSMGTDGQELSTVPREGRATTTYEEISLTETKIMTWPPEEAITVTDEEMETYETDPQMTRMTEGGNEFVTETSPSSTYGMDQTSTEGFDEMILPMADSTTSIVPSTDHPPAEEEGSRMTTESPLPGSSTPGGESSPISPPTTSPTNPLSASTTDGRFRHSSTVGELSWSTWSPEEESRATEPWYVQQNKLMTWKADEDQNDGGFEGLVTGSTGSAPPSSENGPEIETTAIPGGKIMTWPSDSGLNIQEMVTAAPSPIATATVEEVATAGPDSSDEMHLSNEHPQNDGESEGSSSRPPTEEPVPTNEAETMDGHTAKESDSSSMEPPVSATGTPRSSTTTFSASGSSDQARSAETTADSVTEPALLMETTIAADSGAPAASLPNYYVLWWSTPIAILLHLFMPIH